MAKKHMVTCRVCKEKFDTNSGVNWIQPTPRFYYHTQCYTDWQTKKDNVKTNDLNAELWQAATYDYMRRELYIPVEYPKFDNQWKSLVKKGRTPKGIYFAVRYFYEQEHGDKTKANGGIGIVDYVYARSSEYWCSQERNGNRIVSQIEEQIKQRNERETVQINRPQKKKKTKQISFASIEELGDN